MSRAKLYYLQERHNPQFKEPYYIKLGQITKKEAKKKEATLFGTNYILSYQTEEEYQLKIEELEKAGKRFI